MGSTLSALNFAIRGELDSILFYQEMRTYVPRDHGMVDKIIAEERRHFSILSEVRKNLM